MRKKVSKKAVSHLKEDIKGYKKQQKHLSHEIKEDKDLVKVLKGAKNGGKKKKACCKGCEKGHNAPNPAGIRACVKRKCKGEVKEFRKK